MFSNNLTICLGLLSSAVYVLVYTPLKLVSTMSFIIGAFPGAMPALFVGYAAVSGKIDQAALFLFLIAFFL